MSDELRSMFALSLTREILEQVQQERTRQVEKEGFSRAHDDAHKHGEMAHAAACYAIASVPGYPDSPLIHVSLWPWEKEWWKPRDRRRNLIRAAALLVAEIERLDRAGRDNTTPHSIEEWNM